MAKEINPKNLKQAKEVPLPGFAEAMEKLKNKPYENKYQAEIEDMANRLKEEAIASRRAVVVLRHVDGDLRAFSNEKADLIEILGMLEAAKDMILTATKSVNQREPS